MADEQRVKKMAIIAAQGTLDWAYPPLILASAAAAMDMEVQIFYTFYGLPILKKDLDPKIAPATNPAMPMKMPFGPDWFKKINWKMPNALMGNAPGFESFATGLMKKTFANHGVATIEELRELCMDVGVEFIACQMTMDVFGFTKEEFIDGVNYAGAAAFLDFAADADIQLFI